MPAPLLSGCLDSNIWNGLLLQAGHSESTIRHAIMAVSSAHEQYETANALETGSNITQSADPNLPFASPRRFMGLITRSASSRAGYSDETTQIHVEGSKSIRTTIYKPTPSALISTNLE
jgi:hypothetical protein